MPDRPVSFSWCCSCLIVLFVKQAMKVSSLSFMWMWFTTSCRNTLQQTSLFLKQHRQFVYCPFKINEADILENDHGRERFLHFFLCGQFCFLLLIDVWLYLYISCCWSGHQVYMPSRQLQSSAIIYCAVHLSTHWAVWQTSFVWNCSNTLEHTSRRN